MSYCSRACLDEDQSDHVLECARMPRLTPLSDLARLLARLCLKAADQARNDVSQWSIIFFFRLSRPERRG